MTRVCRSCGATKLLDCFGPKATWCRTCARDYEAGRDGERFDGSLRPQGQYRPTPRTQGVDKGSGSAHSVSPASHVK